MHAGGGTLDPHGVLTTMATYGDIEVRVKMVVASLGGNCGLLGMDFLIATDAAYDFHTGTLEFDSCQGRAIMNLTRPLPKTTYVGYLDRPVPLSPRTHTMVECVFQRCMESVPRSLVWKDCLVYIDEIVVAGSD